MLGRATKGRAGFISIHTDVNIDADLSHKEKEAFLQDIEKRCPIADNMSGATRLSEQSFSFCA
ncbi:OsmC family protein [Orrella sp. 11846]|uniref:OsmC family protein n=1 Tax=Orrella sp. 11846 TaxID=3409913 RepID=UPI003B5BF6DB